MSVRVVSPLEQAVTARGRLSKALLKLSEAQLEVVQAAETLAHFEVKLRSGWLMGRADVDVKVCGKHVYQDDLRVRCVGEKGHDGLCYE